jgi:hypothetical protein
MVQLGSAGLRQVPPCHPLLGPLSPVAVAAPRITALHLVQHLSIRCFAQRTSMPTTLRVFCRKGQSAPQDEALTLQLLRGAEPGGRLAMSTAYLNLTKPYERALAAAGCQVAAALLLGCRCSPRQSCSSSPEPATHAKGHLLQDVSWLVGSQLRCRAKEIDCVGCLIPCLLPTMMAPHVSSPGGG